MREIPINRIVVLWRGVYTLQPVVQPVVRRAVKCIRTLINVKSSCSSHSKLTVVSSFVCNAGDHFYRWIRRYLKIGGNEYWKLWNSVWIRLFHVPAAISVEVNARRDGWRVVLDTAEAVDDISLVRRGGRPGHRVEPRRRPRPRPLRDLEVAATWRPVDSGQRGVDARIARDGTEQSQRSAPPIQTLLARDDRIGGSRIFTRASEASEHWGVWAYGRMKFERLS